VRKLKQIPDGASYKMFLQKECLNFKFQPYLLLIRYGFYGIFCVMKPKFLKFPCFFHIHETMG